MKIGFFPWILITFIILVPFCLGEDEDDVQDDWSAILNVIRNIRLTLESVPLPASSAKYRESVKDLEDRRGTLEKMTKDVDKLLEDVKEIYGNFAEIMEKQEN